MMHEDLATNLALALQVIPREFFNTCYMVFVSLFFAILIGMPLGVVLTLTKEGGLKRNRSLYRILSFVINVGRSLPFAILIVALIPLTRLIIGTSIGTTASIVPLTLAAAPFVARIVEAALSEVDSHLIEAALVMGSNSSQIVRKVYLPEALVSLVNGITLTAVTLIGYSAMAGLVGGGGLGKIAIQYGYQRFNGFLMGSTLFVLVILVMGVQMIGNKISNFISSSRGVL